VGFILSALVLGGLQVPIPVFYAYLPGPVRDVEQLVEVTEAPTYPSDGQLLLTTVYVDVDVTVLDVLRAAADPSRVLVTKDQVVGDSSLRELKLEQEREMEDSKQSAREVVFAMLGYGRPTGKGAKVVSTIAGAPARGVLLPGDVITEVDGKPIETTCDAGAAISSHSVGEKVSVTLERDGRRKTISVGTQSDPINPSSAVVGVVMKDIGYRFEPGVQADFETGRVAGPSAGLVLSLALYDRLTPGDLTGGRKIAGTGTIQCDGQVGAIGGVEQKVAAAEGHGSDLFLSPAANVEAARGVADEMDVVAVSTFEDAVDYLEKLD
jgi:Lon-like protease